MLRGVICQPTRPPFVPRFDLEKPNTDTVKTDQGGNNKGVKYLTYYEFINSQRVPMVFCAMMIKERGRK